MGGYSTTYGSSSRYDWDKSNRVTRKSARDYAKDDKREYSRGSGLDPPAGKEIKTESPLAAVLMLDVTGSMQGAPKLMIDKMPTLYSESNAAIQGAKLEALEKGKKLEDKLELAVVAVGDAYVDRYPLQVLDFTKGANLVKGVNSINPEGGGGGSTEESYEIAAYYLLHHCSTPNVPKDTKPLLIIAGDERFYDEVKKDFVKNLIGDSLKSNADSKEVMKQLSEQFDTYILRPELCYSAEEYKLIQKAWEGVLGPQRALRMKESYDRLVDCFIGICGAYSNSFKTSKDLLERRQTPKQVAEVLETLHPLLDSGKKRAEKSKSR